MNCRIDYVKIIRAIIAIENQPKTDNAHYCIEINSMTSVSLKSIHTADTGILSTTTDYSLWVRRARTHLADRCLLIPSKSFTGFVSLAPKAIHNPCLLTEWPDEEQLFYVQLQFATSETRCNSPQTVEISSLKFHTLTMDMKSLCHFSDNGTFKAAVYNKFSNLQNCWHTS